MKKKKMLIAHNNPGIIEKILREYEDNDFITLAAAVTDGQALLKLNSLNNFDIVIVKNALSYITGLYALDILLRNTMKRPAIIILITPFVNEFVHNKCRRIGIDYIPDFNVDCSKIVDIINFAEISKVIQNKTYFEPSTEVILLFKQLGILRTYIGYRYLEYALNIILEDQFDFQKKMTELYEFIGVHFNVTASSVEKAMRSCINLSFRQNNTFYARMLFGHDIKNNNFPSTSTFIQVCIKTLKELKQTINNKNLKNIIKRL